MDDKTFSETVKRLGEVNKVIEGLDPSIRAAAFSILQNYVTHGHETPVAKRSLTEVRGAVDEDRADFFSRFVHDKPAENAVLLAADHFRKYGSEAFTVEEMKEWGREVGVTIPDRLDMTLRAAARDGKNLFHRTGNGTFNPTVHGEAHFKKAYGVTKGTSRKVATPAETQT